MKVSELIDALLKLPQDAEVFYGMDFGNDEADGLPIFGLYPVDPVFYERVWSCRSMLPSSRSHHENVVLITDC